MPQKIRRKQAKLNKNSDKKLRIIDVSIPSLQIRLRRAIASQNGEFERCEASEQNERKRIRERRVERKTVKYINA